MKTLRLERPGPFPCLSLIVVALCFSGCAHLPHCASLSIPEVEGHSRLQAAPSPNKQSLAGQQPATLVLCPAERAHTAGSISITSAALLALIVIGVLVPASVPIVGRIFALLVTRLPGLAGISGVVSVEAFDAIVKAIERSKQTVHFANEPAFDDLHAHLSRGLDSAHKRLVRARKQTFSREDWV